MFRKAHRTGFTLIELMVVIGIIGLLITIALPSFINVRKQAKRTTTAATLNTLDTGIISFRSDSQLGGNYPISYRIPICANPHGAGNLQDPDGPNGAELLAWALVGADQLGTPGFKNIDGIAKDPNGVDDDSLYGGWTSDSGKTPFPFVPPPPTTPPQLYCLDGNAQPFYHRTTGLVDPTKMKFPKVDKASGKFIFDDLPGKPLRPTISFLDSFGEPILYYRANRTAQQFASWGDSTGQPPGNNPRFGVYEMDDNANFTGWVLDDGAAGAISTGGMDLGAGINHPFGHFASPSVTGPLAATPTTPIPIKGCFQAVLQNMSISAKRQTFNEDTYILLSAGPDGLYGTGDDVANFPLNQ